MLKLENIEWSVWWNRILKWIDLDVKKGEAIWVIWPNGCWKTSLINSINGFNKLSNWKIYFKWKKISKLSIEKRSLLWMWRVFQSPWIFKTLTLYENLAFAFVNRLSWKYKILPSYFFPEKIKFKIDSLLKDLDLYKKRGELAWCLSWWQMRLLEIARLYLQDTDLYLLDEPTAWVSPKLKSKVIKLIKKITDMWKTVIIVEHDFNFIWKFVDRLILMEDGKVILDWKYSEVKNSEVIEEVYFWK